MNPVSKMVITNHMIRGNTITNSVDVEPTSSRANLLMAWIMSAFC